MLARLASLNPNEKKIDKALLGAYHEINGKIDSIIYQHEKKFHDAQMKFAHAQTKEETVEALEDMRTHAMVHDILEKSRNTIKQHLKYIQRECQEEIRRISGNQ